MGSVKQSQLIKNLSDGYEYNFYKLEMKELSVWIFKKTQTNKKKPNHQQIPTKLKQKPKTATTTKKNQQKQTYS